MIPPPSPASHGALDRLYRQGSPPSLMAPWPAEYTMYVVSK